MAHYMLVLHSDPAGWQKLSPEQMQKATEKFFAWTKKPFLVEARRLTWSPGKVLRNVDGKPRATDGPYSETKESFGGYFRIEAADYDQAVALAADHPGLEYGGTIEVREVWKM
jgi:hypothetical protein